MEEIRSVDGTTIAVERRGNGPALVVVAGLLCDRRAFGPLADLLGAHFTVHTYDRRGRGDSTDTAPYAPAREVEDLDAVIGAAGGSAAVFGHSSGAALGLMAAARGVPISRLVAYEPPYAVEPGSGDLRGKVAGLLADGRHGDAVRHFLGEAGVPAEMLDEMAADPSWSTTERMAPTLLHDLDLVGDTGLPRDLLAAIGVPTLVLGGGDSAGWFQETVRAVADAVPGARCRFLAGQEHNPADDVLAPVVVDFLGGER